MSTEEGDGSPADPDVEMDVIEPLDLLHMRKYLNLVSEDLSDDHICSIHLSQLGYHEVGLGSFGVSCRNS